MPALSAVLSTRVGRRRKFWELSCTECTAQRNDFELIPTVEMETRNPVEGYFPREFPAICNHCGVIAAWTRNTLKYFEIFAFFGKTTHYGKIFKILLWKFLSRHQSMCCVQISWNLADGKSVKSCVAYLTKKQFRLALQLSLLRGSRTKSVRASLWQYTQNAPDFILIGSVSAKVTRTCEHSQNEPYSESNIRLKPNVEPNNK